MKYRNILTVILLIGFAGCYGRPTPEAISSAYYGPEPTNIEEKVRSYWALELFDPYSAVIKCNPPCKAATSTPLWLGKHKFGWAVNCTINAKNRYGGYVGAKVYQFFIADTGYIIKPAGRPRCI